MIVATLGDGALAAAQGLVAAEQNFNPFATDVPSICGDPTLPTTAALRGIVPLVDPAVDGSDVENANSAASLTNPFDATGLSVADVMAANGFTNLNVKGGAGGGAANNAANGADNAANGANNGADNGANNGAANGANNAAANDAAAAVSTAAPAATAAAAQAGCGGATTLVTVTRAKAAAATAAADTGAADAAGAATAATDNGAAGIDPGFQKSSIAANDFGTCTPTIKFEPGLNGRDATEFTFQAVDPVVNKGQSEALNPNIITNRICDQLGNVCGASDAGVAACTDAQAQIEALGTRDQTTADAWNTALGFAGADTNPDNAPQAGLVGHT